MLKAYLQAMADVGEGAARRAAQAARQTLAGSPGADPLATGAGVDELAGQGAALVHELLTRTRRQREALRDVVRAEFETLVSQSAGQEPTALAAQLAASRARVRELERELAAARGVGPSARSPRPAPVPRAGAARAPSKAASAKVTRKAAPAKVTSGAAPVKVSSKAAPAKVTSGAAPVKASSKAAPAKVTSKAAPAKVTRRSARTAAGAGLVPDPGAGGTPLGAQRAGARPAGTGARA